MWNARARVFYKFRCCMFRIMYNIMVYVQRPDRYKVRNETTRSARSLASIAVVKPKKKHNAQHIHTPTEQTDFSFSAPSSSGNCVNSMAVTHTYFAQSKACQPDHHCGRLGVLCWVYCACVSYVMLCNLLERSIPRGHIVYKVFVSLGRA